MNLRRNAARVPAAWENSGRRVTQWPQIFRSLGATFGDRLAMATITGLAALTPFVFVFAHRGVAPLALAIGLIVATRAPVWRAGLPRFLIRPNLKDPLVRAALCLLALCGWASASAFWSPSPHAWRLSLSVAGPALAAGAIVFEIARRPAAQTRLLAAAAEAAFVAAVALLLFEALTGGYLRSITPPADQSGGRNIDFVALGRGMTALTTLFFGGIYLSFAKGRRRWFIAALFAGAVVAASRLSIFANELALIVGAASGAAALRAPRAVIVALAVFILIVLAAAPLAALLPVGDMFAATPDGAPVSWLQRLVIWKTAANEAVRCLPWGCGVEYARSLSAAGVTAPVPNAEQGLPILPTHPHNAAIEIWLELGLPGVVLFALAIASAAQAVLSARLGRAAEAAIAASAASFLVEFLVELSLWQAWRLAGAALAAMMIALAIRTQEARPGTAFNAGSSVPNPKFGS